MYATICTLNEVDGASPRTVQVSLPGLPVPTSGVAHVPCVTLGAELKSIGAADTRMSYDVVPPEPLATCVNCTVAELSVVDTTVRSVTVPGGCITTLLIATFAAPVTPALTAETVTVPSPVAVPVPSESTRMTAALLVCHSTRRPASTFPAASVSVAANRAVCPMATFTCAGVIAMAA